MAIIFTRSSSSNTNNRLCKAGNSSQISAMQINTTVLQTVETEERRPLLLDFSYRKILVDVSAS